MAISWKEKFVDRMHFSLKFVSKDLVDNISGLIKIMARCWIVNKPLCEQMLTMMPYTILYHPGASLSHIAGLHKPLPELMLTKMPDATYGISKP